MTTNTIRTEGVSPKTVLAFLLPLILALGGSLVSWVATGDFNEAETRTALGGALAAVLAGGGAWLGSPGDIVDDSLPTYFQGATQGPVPEHDEGDGEQAPGGLSIIHPGDPKDAA